MDLLHGSLAANLGLADKQGTDLTRPEVRGLGSLPGGHLKPGARRLGQCPRACDAGRCAAADALRAQDAPLEHEFCYVKRANRLVLSVTTHSWGPKVRLAMARHAGREYARHAVMWHASAAAGAVDMTDFTLHEVQLAFRFRSTTYLATLDLTSSEKCTFIDVFRKAAQQTLVGMDVPTAWLDGVYISSQ